MENPIKMDDLGVPLFLETPICIPWESVTFIFRGYIYNPYFGGFFNTFWGFMGFGFQGF